MPDKRPIIIANKVNDEQPAELANLNLDLELAVEADMVISRASNGHLEIVKIRWADPDKYEIWVMD